VLLAWTKKFDSILSFVQTRVPKSHCLRTHYQLLSFQGKKGKRKSIHNKNCCFPGKASLFFFSGGKSGGNFGKTAERERDAREPKKERGE